MILRKLVPCLLLAGLRCGACSTVQGVSQPRRCITHDSSPCRTCSVMAETLERTNTAEGSNHAAIFVTQLGSMTLDDSNSGLLSIAAELLQDGFRVTVLFIYSNQLNETRQHVDAMLKRRILSSLPCEVEATVGQKLTIQSAPIHRTSVDETSSALYACDMPMHIYASPFDSCALQLAEPIAGTLLNLIDENHLPDVVVLNASLLGGLLVAEQLKIATIAIAPPQLLDLLTEKEEEPLAVMRKPYAGGLRSLIRNRWHSFLLSGAFVRLNQVRKRLGLNPIRNPADCFDAASAIIVNTSPQLELYRFIPDHIHLVGPLLPQCVPCLNQSETSVPQSILDIGTENATESITIAVLPMDLSLKHSRALLRGLSFARTALQSYATEVCKQLERSADESCGLMGQMLSLANEMELQSLAEEACKKQNSLWKKQCNRSLAMSRFNVVWLQNGGEEQLVPQALPLFVTLENTPLVDIAARYSAIGVVVSHCDGSDSQEALLMGLPVLCVPTTNAQVESTLQLRAMVTRYGVVRVNLVAEDIAKELLGMLLSIQFERMREDLSTMEIDHIFQAPVQSANPLDGARAASEMFMHAGGVQRAVRIIREAAFIQKRSSASSTWQTRLFLSLQLGQTRRHIVNESGSYVVFLAWLVVAMTILVLANAWTALPTWLLRGIRQQLPQQYPSQFAHIGRAKMRLYAWLKSLDLVADEEAQNRSRRTTDDCQHHVRGTSTNMRRRRTARRR